MKERPILFSTENVKAILDGRKTMTRRVVNKNNSIIGEGGSWSNFCWDGSQEYKDTCHHGHTEIAKAPLPFIDGRASEHYPYEHQYLHVPYRWQEDCTIYRIYPKWDVGDILWIRRNKQYKFIWKKADADIWLEITNIRVERVKEISHEDAIAEGAEYMPAAKLRIERLTVPQIVFAGLWDSINAKRGYSWKTNPWVWVIEFKRIGESNE